MVERFKSLVNSVGIFEAIKYIGGFDLFKDLVETNPSLKEYFNMLKASCSVSHNGYPDAYFDFYIKDIFRSFVFYVSLSFIIYR